MKKIIPYYSIILLLIILLINNITIGIANTSEWSMYQHDTENSGFSSSLFPNSLNITYNLTYKEIINSTFFSPHSSPIVSNSKIFIAGSGKEADIIVLDENDCSLIWKKKIISNDSSTIYPFINSPVVSNGKIFVCYGSFMNFPPQSRIFALNENTGDVIWGKRIFTCSSYPSITISNDKLIIGGHFTNFIPISFLYVFDADNGDLIWRKTMRGFFESTPVVSNNTVFTATSCKSPLTLGLNIPIFSRRARVYAFDLNDGSKKWMTRVKGHVIFSSPSVSNGKLLVPSNIMGLYRWNRRVTSLNIETGKEIWNYQIKYDIMNSSWPTSISTPSVAYGKIFITDASGFIIALDEGTGEMLWKSEIIEEIKGPSSCSSVPPVIADNKVIVTSFEISKGFAKNKICMFNTSDGRNIWNFELHFSEGRIMAPFSIANGKLFVNTDNRIYVYN